MVSDRKKEGGFFCKGYKRVVMIIKVYGLVVMM